MKEILKEIEPGVLIHSHFEDDEGNVIPPVVKTPKPSTQAQLDQIQQDQLIIMGAIAELGVLL